MAMCLLPSGGYMPIGQEEECASTSSACRESREDARQVWASVQDRSRGYQEQDSLHGVFVIASSREHVLTGTDTGKRLHEDLHEDNTLQLLEACHVRQAIFSHVASLISSAEHV